MWHNVLLMVETEKYNLSALCFFKNTIMKNLLVLSVFKPHFLCKFPFSFFLLVYFSSRTYFYYWIILTLASSQSFLSGLDLIFPLCLLKDRVQAIFSSLGIAKKKGRFFFSFLDYFLDYFYWYGNMLLYLPLKYQHQQSHLTQLSLIVKALLHYFSFSTKALEKFFYIIFPILTIPLLP